MTVLKLQKSQWWLLLLVMVLAIFFRTFELSTVPPGLYPDEAMNGTDALRANETGHYSVFYPANNGREGLFIDVQAIALKVAHVNQPWVLRSVGALFGVVTILGLFLLGRELFTPAIGLWAAFFMTTGFWHLTFSRMGFRAISAPCWLVWALCCFLIGYRKSSEGGGLLSASSWHMTAGLLFGLGFHSYIAYRVTPALILLIAACYYVLARRGGWLRIYIVSSTIFLFFSVAATLPLLIYFLRTSGSFTSRSASISIFSQPHPLLALAGNVGKELLMFNFIGDFNWRTNFSGRPELSGPVGVLLIIGMAVGIGPAKRFLSDFGSSIWNRRTLTPQASFPAGNGFSFVILSFWLVVASVPALLSKMGGPSSIRFLLLTPVVYMLAAVGAAKSIDLLATIMQPQALRICCGLLCLALIVETGALYFIAWPQNANTKAAFTADYTDIAKTINALPATTPKYVVYPYFGYDPKLNLSVPAQTIMFMTGTSEEDQQRAKNVHYVIEGHEELLPTDARVFHLRVYDQGQTAQ